jgi:hypothetical protein
VKILSHNLNRLSEEKHEKYYSGLSNLKQDYSGDWSIGKGLDLQSVCMKPSKFGKPLVNLLRLNSLKSITFGSQLISWFKEGDLGQT